VSRSRTVLANEEVIDGKSESAFPVVRRPMRQWMLRITPSPIGYSRTRRTRLAAGIKLLHEIGSEKRRREIDFKIDKHEQKIGVFTTRPDTLYGGTFLVLAPEHPLIDLIVTRSSGRRYANIARRPHGKASLNERNLRRKRPAFLPAPTH